MLELLESELKGEFIFFVLELFGPYTQMMCAKRRIYWEDRGLSKGTAKLQPWNH